MEYEPSPLFMIYLFLTSKALVSLPLKKKKKNELITASQENS